MSEFFSDLFSLQGKHALVTGGGSGIGQMLATTLARAGARVTVVGRRVAPLQETVRQIATSGGQARHAIFDASEIDKSADFIAQLQNDGDSFGAVDILINNAGFNPRRSIADTTPEDWRAVIDSNLSSAFFLARAAAPAMIANGWGRILNLASLQSALAFKNGAAYGAAKSGISQLTRAMAREWSEHGITANAIAPGFFPTDLTAPVLRDSPETANHLAARTAIGRNGALEDLQGAALLFCSPAGRYITGQTLFIDGGFTAV